MSDLQPPTGSLPPQPADALERLGWQPFFAQQASIEVLAQTPPVRVVAVHRNGLTVRGYGIETTVLPRADATAGDWLLLNAAQPAQSVVLQRKSLIQRRAAGDDRRQQLIAANIDTCFIVSSCNQEFNLARLERYLALVFEANVTPVIILTKADLCTDPGAFVAATRAIADKVEIVVLNGLSDAPRAALRAWCTAGQTVAFVGSSGVGKSTLVNSLFGDDAVPTAEVRDDDAKGRHTTRHRELYFLPDGCALMDTPGMRELQLAEAEEGVEEVFSDLADLASQCRFSDCQHDTEPGCAIRKALAEGQIDRARLDRWKKLAAEEQANSTAMTKRKPKDKVISKAIRAHKKKSQK